MRAREDEEFVGEKEISHVIESEVVDDMKAMIEDCDAVDILDELFEENKSISRIG